MDLIQEVKITKYRMNMRKAMQKASIDELRIAKEEVARELNRRFRK